MQALQQVCASLVEKGLLTATCFAVWRDDTANKSKAKQAALLGILTWVNEIQPKRPRAANGDDEEDGEGDLDGPGQDDEEEDLGSKKKKKPQQQVYFK